MKIGLVLPQRAVVWKDVKDAALRAEDMGCDSLWVIDHLLTVPPERGLLEAWTLLSALAAVTTRVELGAQVLCQSFRNPALLAKMAATLDEVSVGRFRLLIGAGWFENEYDAFGYEFPEPGIRIEELQDTIRILKGMLSSADAFTYEGKHYRTEGAINAPLRRPIPIEVGGARDRLLRTVAREADGWNVPAIVLPMVDDRLEFLRSQCERNGRKIDELRLSCQITCTVGDADALNDPGLQFYNPATGLAGDVDEAATRARELIDRGIRDFHVVVPQGDSGWKCLQRLIDEVKPKVS